MAKEVALIVLLVLCFVAGVCFFGCAGKPAGTPVWTQADAVTWDYGYPAGALLGRVVLLDRSYSGYGCENRNITGESTLEGAEAYVESSCADEKWKAK